MFGSSGTFSNASGVSLIMKSYPLGIDNPILVKGVWGSHKWALYWKDSMQKIATFNDQFSAYQARSAILSSHSA